MKRKRGLTLVELIVVIGLILFIATAFIFPAFERARGRATEVVCVSNLRQIGQALLMYAQDHDGIVPPYCNQVELGSFSREEWLELLKFHGQRWQASLIPYVKEKGIFFCPIDPFRGLPPEKTPGQGLPQVGEEDVIYAHIIDHSVSSYRVLLEEDWFKKGYYPTTDIYANMANYPQEWLFAPSFSERRWEPYDGVSRLHEVAVYLDDYTHFLRETGGAMTIELFYDGHVEIHRPCSIWRMLEEYFSKFVQEGKKP